MVVDTMVPDSGWRLKMHDAIYFFEVAGFYLRKDHISAVEPCGSDCTVHVNGYTLYIPKCTADEFMEYMTGRKTWGEEKPVYDPTGEIPYPAT